MNRFLLLIFTINICFSQMVSEKLKEVNMENDLSNKKGYFIYLDAEKYVNNSNIVSVRPLLKIEFYYLENSYIENQRFTTTFRANISPISINGNIDLTYSPFNFLEIPAGIICGTGWYNEYFGKGIGIYSNFYDEGIKENVYSLENFTKIYLKYYLSTKLNLDFEYFNSFISQTLYYRYFLGTKKDEDVWLYENIPDNLKYFRYSYEIYSGFKLPFLLNRIGIFYSADYDITHYSQSKVIDGGWGSDIAVKRFGLIFSSRDFKIFYKKTAFDFILIWGNEPNYEEGQGNNLILQNRKIRKDIPEYYFLREVSLIFKSEI
ncbi:MAG: hypothetical protein N2258_01685 [Brevinematales bacterium]|nr:hypothetical protein [Brevinematales bacterium]